MKKEDIQTGTVVRNKKHGGVETIVGTGMMRLPDGTWVKSVNYQGVDRFSGVLMHFTRELRSFLDDFDLVTLEEIEIE